MESEDKWKVTNSRYFSTHQMPCFTVIDNDIFSQNEQGIPACQTPIPLQTVYLCSHGHIRGHYNCNQNFYYSRKTESRNEILSRQGSWETDSFETLLLDEIGDESKQIPKLFDCFVLYYMVWKFFMLECDVENVCFYYK